MVQAPPSQDNQTSVPGFGPSAQEATNLKVLIIDPNKIDQKGYEALKSSIPDDDPQKAKKLQDFLANEVKKQFEEQAPGITRTLTDIPDTDLAAIAQHAMTEGYPFSYRAAVQNGAVCLIATSHGQKTERDNFFPTMAGGAPLISWKPIPMTQGILDRMIATHEGAHCEEEVPNLPRDHPGRPLQILKDETVVDSEAMKQAVKEGNPEAAKAFYDFRILGAILGEDITHATAFFLNERGEITDTPSQEKIESIKQVKDVLINTVAEKLGISEDKARLMMSEDHKTFMTAAEEAIKNGELKTSNPDVKQYAQMFVTAYKNRIDIEGPSPYSFEVQMNALAEQLKAAQEASNPTPAPAETQPSSPTSEEKETPAPPSGTLNQAPPAKVGADASANSNLIPSGAHIPAKNALTMQQGTQKVEDYTMRGGVLNQPEAGPKDGAAAAPTASGYQIAVKSYQVANVLGVVAIHHEVVFLKDGKPIMALNGDPYNRETGEFVGDSRTGQDTLRVRLFDGHTVQEIDTKNEYPVVHQGVVANLSEEEFMRKMALAIETAQFINSQNVNYNIIGGPFPGGMHTSAQNSNSAASTLLASMGLTYPPGADQFIAPGKDRVMLPANWKPATQDMTVDELKKYIQENAEKLLQPAVQNQVKTDPNPPQNFFDPAKPQQSPSKAPETAPAVSQTLDISLGSEQLTQTPLPIVSALARGSYDYMAAYHPGMKSGIKVDLSSGDQASMTIHGQSPSAYFTAQASGADLAGMPNPALVADTSFALPKQQQTHRLNV